jgi:hypothetical protein
MNYEKEIKTIENKLLVLSAELISLIPENNEIIKIKKDYYKNLTIALQIIKNQNDELNKSDIMRYCS